LEKPNPAEPEPKRHIGVWMNSEIGCQFGHNFIFKRLKNTPEIAFHRIAGRNILEDSLASTQRSRVEVERRRDFLKKWAGLS
jgi:hypothetical protein